MQQQAHQGIGDVSFIWLEITGRCQLECTHCYAGSGPGGTHGTMSYGDWTSVLDQLADLRVGMVQFIGGEPTLHPDFPSLVRYALDRGLEVEVFTNLVHVSSDLWEAYALPKVSLATSYYTDDPAQHAAITRRPTYARTKANITEALRRGIALRAGVIDMGEGQRAEQGQAELVDLGLPYVGYDQLRQVGRGVRGGRAPGQEPSTDQLCGNCGDGVAAISPTGEVWPCVFARWMPAGNVHQQPLAEILAGDQWAARRTELAAAFTPSPKLGNDTACRPSCNPVCYPRCGPACQPNCGPSCSPACQPCGPGRRCWPFYEN